MLEISWCEGTTAYPCCLMFEWCGNSIKRRRDGDFSLSAAFVAADIWAVSLEPCVMTTKVPWKPGAPQAVIMAGKVF